MIFLIFGGFRAVGFGGVSGSVVEYINGLYTIYLTKFYKVLVKIIYRVIIVFNFYIYKKLFSLISLTFKIFCPFILN